MSRQGLTQTEFGRRIGMVRGNVSKMVKAGQLKTLSDGSIDPAEVKRLSKTSANGINGADTTAADFFLHRAIREKANAERAQLELKQLEGSMLPREGVEETVFTVHRMVRDQLLSVPARIAPTLVGCNSARTLEQVMTREIQQALEGLAGELDALESTLSG